jgi:regulatory protein
MPGTITALVVQKKNKERVNVYLDGEFAFGLTMIEAIKLKKGQQLDDAEIKRLKALDEIEVAKDHALNFLSYRPRSADEVKRHLREKGYSDSVIEIVMERLEQAGLVDDETFARFWVENRDRFKPLSERALAYELKKKGVSDAAIEAALEVVDEHSAAYRAGLERAPRFRSLDKNTFRKRLGDYLARRGFSYDVVRDAVDRLWEAFGSEGDSSAHRDQDMDWED